MSSTLTRAQALDRLLLVYAALDVLAELLGPTPKTYPLGLDLTIKLLAETTGDCAQALQQGLGVEHA